MQRTLVSFAVLVLAAVSFTAVPAGAGGDGHGGNGGDGHGADMGDDHGGGGGGDHEENAPVEPGARKIRVTATSFKFVPKDITIQAREDVAIVLTSKDVFHDFVVQRVGHIVGAKKGKTRSGGLVIDEPRTYKIWCSISGHRKAGMKGTLIVQ